MKSLTGFPFRLENRLLLLTGPLPAVDFTGHLPWPSRSLSRGGSLEQIRYNDIQGRYGSLARRMWLHRDGQPVNEPTVSSALPRFSLYPRRS
jgi:hypothetical protein